VELKDTSHWKWTAVKESGIGKETADPQREGEGVETQLNQNKGIEETYPASYHRNRPQEATPARRVRYERISTQKKHQTPLKMISFAYWLIIIHI
jgi:hypothetical protein